MDLAEAPRGRSQHPETARPEGSSLRRTLRGTRQRQDRRQGSRSSPKGPVPGRRRRREPPPHGAVCVAAAVPRREQVLSASPPPSPRREPTPSASPTPSARREQVLSASPAPSPRREPTPFASPAPPPRREPTLFASPAPPPRREPTLFASPAPPPRREPAPCGRASRRSPRRRLLTAGPRLGQRGSSASAVSWMSACPRVLLDVHCASDIRMRCRRSVLAIQGPSRLTTRGVTDGTPSANSPAKERFTNSGAPTM